MSTATRVVQVGIALALVTFAVSTWRHALVVLLVFTVVAGIASRRNPGAWEP